MNYKVSVLLIIITCMFWIISGCGGGSSSGTVPDLSNPSSNDTNNGTGTSGTFTITVMVPSSGTGSSSDVTSSVIPYRHKILKVTITGEAINPKMESSLDISASSGTASLTVNSVPVGLNTALIEIFAEDGTTLLAQRKHGFYLIPGETENAGTISMGVSIDDTNLCSPAVIDIPVGTKLFFENRSLTEDKTVTAGSVSVGPISKVKPASEPDSEEVYYAQSYTFDTPGMYSYSSGHGGNNTETYRVLVYDLPTLESITPPGDTNNSTSNLSFTLKGTNFGTSREMVDGIVDFMKLPSFETLGNVGFSAGSASETSLCVYNGTPYVAYGDGDSHKAIVMKYNGTSWEAVGSPTGSSVDSISLSVYNGTPYVAYCDWVSSGRATVMKYNGTSWENVGLPRFSAGYVVNTSISVYNGTPYVAYYDGGNGGKATVMKYNGTSWEAVGTPGFSSGTAYYTSLSVYNGTPYVAYRDNANGSKATVMKYNGTSWENVGSPGFSAGSASYTSLSVYNGTPYVAYQDDGNSGKATVMKYNGTSWEAVGSPGFSAGSAGYTSLSIYNGTPYVASQYGDKAIVMKYNGTSWENIGYSSGSASYTSLSVYNGTPYVAYQDGGNSNKATVMKYNGTYKTNPVSSSNLTWSDKIITGNISIPSGFYRLQVTVRGTNTLENVYFARGSGTFSITAYSQKEQTPPINYKQEIKEESK